MTTLRLHLAAPPAADEAVAWGLFDASGVCTRTGRTVAAEWPSADRVEAVLAAAHVRIATVTLPPLAPARVAAAAGFAVDDQLAGPKDAQHLAVSRQAADGRVRVVIAARALVEALRRSPAIRVARLIAEPDLALPYTGWRWCAATANDGDAFVRRSDGSAFPVSAPDAGGALPAELALALVQAKRDGAQPAEIRVEFDATEPDLGRWQREGGVPCVRGAAWRWTAAPATAFADTVDLLQGDFAVAPPPAKGARARLFVPALALAIAALALHIVATVGEWGSLRVEAWRNARAWSALAAGAGLSADAAATPAAAQAALARRYAELRHQHGLVAPDDALPLLARAAPALRTLPPGGVKTATYSDGHWTLDLARVDADAVAALDTQLRQAGVPALVATTAAGVRLRLGAH
jgi:type II secretion system protein L